MEDFTVVEIWTCVCLATFVVGLMTGLFFILLWAVGVHGHGRTSGG
jgi:hypothetical protein